MLQPKVLVIAGPTASGKTDFAFQAARLLQDKSKKESAIISADSRQVYKHIPIATAQPPKEYLKEIKHYFISELELNEEFNAGEFGKQGRGLIQKLFKENKTPVIVGGSGLYVSSLIYGFFDFDEIDDKEFEIKRKHIREKLYEQKTIEGIESLHKELNEVDNESGSKMLPSNERRIIRALEVYYLTGTPMSVWQNKKIDIGFEPVVIGLNWDREKLYERINSRVDFMVENGLTEEVKELKQKGYDYIRYNSLNTVGVKEVMDYLDDKITREEMVNLIKQNTRRFAKRQMTWFRKDKNIKWIEAIENELSEELIKF